MKFDLIRPCARCPFKPIPYFEMCEGHRGEIGKSLLSENTPFPCHETVDYALWEEAGRYIPTPGEQHCAGALISLQRSGHLRDNLAIRIAIWQRWFDPRRLDMTAKVYDSIEEFVNDEPPEDTL